MEGLGAALYTVVFIFLLIILVLLILLPVFVFQISGASVRSEALLKKAVAELEKINAHLTPPPPQE